MTQSSLPIDRILSSVSAKKYSRGYLACCTGHPENNPSLMIWENEDGSVGLKCFAGCARKDICAGMGITEQDLYPEDSRYKPRRIQRTLDTTDLSLEKCIDPRFLLAWGVTDSPVWHTPKGKQWKDVVRIAYYNLDGSEYSNARIRTALSATKGSYWEKTGKIIPYGLDKLPDVKDSLTIVEGESDCWTLWQWGFSALGIPGASNVSTLQAEHVKLFPRKVYVIEEPDGAGSKFPTEVASQLYRLGYTGKLYLVSLQGTCGVKDPNDLNKKLFAEGRPKDFVSEYQKSLACARQIDIAPKHNRPEQSGLPEIIIGGQLRERTEDALTALAEAEEGNPRIFVQSGTHHLVRVARDKKKKPIILEMGIAELKNALTNSANYFRAKGKAGEIELIPVSPPKELAEAIIALDPEEWPFPPLEGIVEIPVLRPDGSILDQPGYDLPTHLYYMPQIGLDIPTIAQAPTQEDAKKAAAYIMGFVQDFPFDSLASHANAMGAMLTTVTRQMFEHVPMGLVDANKQGTGKGLLTDCLSLLAIGKLASALSPTGNDDELDKRFTAILLEGETFIVIDNQEGVLRSPVLAKILTSTYHKGRVLGVSKMVNVPQRAIWIANGNNIQVGGDMARRCYRIRMLSEVSNPDAREGFKYPHLKKAIMTERGKMIAALLTIARAWFAAGCPEPEVKLRKLATFTEWSDTIGGMLAYAGVIGFLNNNDELRKEADVDGNAWTLFLATWKQKLGDKECKTADLIAELNKDKDFAETLPEPLGSLYLKEDKSFSRKLGRILAKQNGTPYGPDNLKIEKGEDTHSKVATFKVAGYAGYAGYESPYATREKKQPQSQKTYVENETENKRNHTPHTPHTPQNGEAGKVGKACLNGATSAGNPSPKVFNSEDRVQTPEGSATIRANIGDHYSVYLDNFDPKIGRFRTFSSAQMTLLEEVIIR